TDNACNDTGPHHQTWSLPYSSHAAAARSSSAPHDDPERIVGQRPLQRLNLIPWCAHPHVLLFVGVGAPADCDHRLRLIATIR
ncbi:MAG TPA: hypothetical protein VEQ64_03560, partial [Xanthobacteraceae bacterium]|nr:hypothetical protein [Xanthobacteraceae bacterium]